MLLISAALGLKDKYTQAHGQRVAVYARRLAERVGLASDICQLVAMGGLLHDVGKLALSDRIFSNKESTLSADMLWEVRAHPIIGAHLLKRLHCHETICDAVLYHHERLNGSGYPYGLKGDTIPLSAQIVSVADCFDAITTDRPYQPRKGCVDAFEALNEMAGSCLCPEVVSVFIREIRRNGMIGQFSRPLAPGCRPVSCF